MLSKCANPACSARFRYLRQGRIFNLEIRALSSDDLGQTGYRVEHFWLCDPCAAVMEVVWRNGAVSTQPLYSAPDGDRSERGQRGAPKLHSLPVRE
jgi:hypothetical protein